MHRGIWLREGYARGCGDLILSVHHIRGNGPRKIRANSCTGAFGQRSLCTGARQSQIRRILHKRFSKFSEQYKFNSSMPRVVRVRRKADRVVARNNYCSHLEGPVMSRGQALTEHLSRCINNPLAKLVQCLQKHETHSVQILQLDRLCCG
jgi:hypothetical protein